MSNDKQTYRIHEWRSLEYENVSMWGVQTKVGARYRNTMTPDEGAFLYNTKAEAEAKIAALEAGNE